MKRYKNKKFIVKLLLIIIFVVILVAVKPWKQPSEEMRNLRQVEQQLSLPATESRIEEDAGSNTDWKGANHYNRYIRLNYDNSTNVESVVQKLPSSGWSQVNESESEGSTGYSFVNRDLRTCIIARIFPKSTDSYIILSPATDDFCSFYFRNE